MLESSHAELTRWLRPQETRIKRLPDYQEGTIARREGLIPRFPDVWDRKPAPYARLLEPSENPVSARDIMAKLKAFGSGGDV